MCRWVRPLAADTALLILQHPLEVQQAKGSARLLHLCLADSVMLTGEQFEPAALAAALTADGRTPLLLYPGEGAAPVHELQALRGQGARLRLVVLDGTWRKSRKMLHLNPLLAALPRLALRALPASRYVIRKAHAADQLSSFEAAAYALTGLQADGGEQALAHLLAAFDGFVAQQAACDPRHAVR
jgi:DTW domain-containing protein YfiP